MTPVADGDTSTPVAAGLSSDATDGGEKIVPYPTSVIVSDGDGLALADDDGLRDDDGEIDALMLLDGDWLKLGEIDALMLLDGD